ncbi:hypothetical protein Tco_1007071 [Tanacetum coccineum]|uniref:Uncharacterized protein n=1 Tax=Tanacetum coccineum TaxID=301880 RepID=A0ABQ5FJN1_9ASTR
MKASLAGGLLQLKGWVRAREVAWRGEAEESDAEASFVADTQTASGVGDSRLNTRKNKRQTKTLCRDESTCIKMLMLQPAGYRECTSAIPDQGRTNLYQQAIASTSTYPFSDTHRRKTGATTKCKSRNTTKGVVFTSRGAKVSYHNIGAPSYQCAHYNASMCSIAKAFRMARDWCHSHASVNVELHLLSERTNARQYNKQTVVEVAALITNDFGNGIPSRDIIMNKLHS